MTFSRILRISLAAALTAVSVASVQAQTQQQNPPPPMNGPGSGQGMGGGPGMGGPGMGPGREHRGPPPEAFAACAGQAAGAKVTFVGRRGQPIEATCENSPGGMVARPEWRDHRGMDGRTGGPGMGGPGGMPPGGGAPPQGGQKM